MSIKLNLGISKKIGLPDDGSAGSSCNLEIELDNAALNKPEEFHRRIREAYSACRSAVEDELGNHRVGAKQDTRPTTPPKTEYRNSPSERNDNRFPVSEKQLTFIGQLSKGIKGLSAQKLEDYCQQMFGKVSSQLSTKEAYHAENNRWIACFCYSCPDDCSGQRRSCDAGRNEKGGPEG